jgi:hypothetical protein
MVMVFTHTTCELEVQVVTREITLLKAGKIYNFDEIDHNHNRQVGPKAEEILYGI